MKKSRSNGLWERYSLLKMLKIMRFTIFILLISVSQVLAVNGYSQQAKLSLHFKNVKVEKVLDEIETQTEYKFLYNKETVDVDRKVDVSISDKTVNTVLNDLFKTTSVSYAIFDHQILLSKKNAIQAAQQKERVVTGVVTDESGEALPGVSVVVKGTTNGITTDIDGKYTLKVPANSILQFSFVGMKTQEVVVDKNKLNVVLEEDAIGLDEVVAVGYGTKSRTSVTGAVDVAKSEVLNRKVNTDAMSAIQGALPGVRLTRSSGQTGYNQYKIDIRGASSLNGAQPLVIIDGVPSGYRELELMNPNDIESVTSLKDAAAAIYGARAANGVLLVTTKKGKGKMSVSLTNSLTFSKAALMPVKTTTRQHVEMFNEAYTNDGQATNPFTKYLDYGPYTNKLVEGPFGDTPLILWGDNNWKDALFGTGSIQTHNLSIRGSDEKHSYAVSLGYINEDSMLKFGKNNMKRYNVRLNETYNVSKDLKLNLNIGFGSKNVIEPSELGGAFGQLSKA